MARKKSPRRGRTKRRRKVCIPSNHSSTNSDSEQEEVTLSYVKEGAISSEIKVFARNVMRERMMTKSAGLDVIPVYGGFTIIVLVLQVSQMDFGLVPIV